MSGHVVIVGPETAQIREIARALAARRFGAEIVADASLVGACPDEVACVVVVDDEDLAGTCRAVAAGRPGSPFVIVSAEANLHRAIEALRAGAADYVTPADAEATVTTVERITQHVAFRKMLTELRSPKADPDPVSTILLGESARMHVLRDAVRRAARSEATVLVTGERGTGKSLVAKALHRESDRRSSPFVVVDCACLNGGLVEGELFGPSNGSATPGTPPGGLLTRAPRGTIVLDEIACMPERVQRRLVQALRKRTVPVGETSDLSFDARILATTSVDLGDQTRSGAFRDDLLALLNTRTIAVPSLRERGHDVLVLSQRFIERFAAQTGKSVRGLTPGAARVILEHDFPGNVRELSNWMESAVLTARQDELTEHDLPRASVLPRVEQPHDVVPLDLATLRHIRKVLQAVGGNKSRAARLLGLDRKTLSRKVK